MTSVQRILANHRNRARTGTLVPSSVRTITNGVLEALRTRQGSGRCALTGTFTGAEQAKYEVEITNTTVTVPLPSSPVFSGQGNGELVLSPFSGTAQSFTVELADLGAVLLAAGTDLDGSKVVARTPGAAGNLIHITVDRSTLVYNATNYSLINDLPGGTESIEGPEYDWDTKVMGADKNIPANAHRVAFGSTTNGSIHTQYKKYEGGKWTYNFEPKVEGDKAKGTQIKFVTGGRTVTVTDGTTTEVYTGIITLYDLLSAIKTTSVLLDVEGVVANDRKAGGMASHDLTLRTDAHFTASTGSGGSATGFIDVSVAPGSATELIEAKCWAVSPTQSVNAGLGREIWSLKGSVSGDLGNIQTGIPYTSPDLSLTIPSKLPEGYGGTSRGRFSVVSESPGPRDAEDPKMPPICVAAMALGPNAVDQSIELVYTKAPDPTCDCDSMIAPDLTNAFCLTGLEGGTSTMAYSVANVARLTAMYDWVADTYRAKSQYSPSVAAASIFLKELRTLVGLFEKTLGQVNNNTVGETNWDIAFAELQADVAANMGSSGSYTDGLAITPPGVAASAAFPVGAMISLTTQLKPVYYYAVGSSGYVTTGGRIWQGSTSPAGAPADLTAAYNTTDGIVYANATVISATILEGNSYNNVITITYSWINPEILGGRHETRLNWVLMSAGVSPLGKSDASTATGGDGCWEDKQAPYYWAVKGSAGGVYGHAYTGEPYFSAREIPGNPGAYQSTREFAFQLNIQCPGDLREGDTITLSIGAAGYPSTYQVGDTLYLPIIAAADLYLAGGNDGDNIQTWHVAGSVAGALPAYLVDAGAPTPYSESGLGFQINPGPIPFSIGDKFSFTIEGGNYRWRKDGGAWSAATSILSTAVALDAGLSLQFTPSAYPSFATSDVFEFTALQPYAVSNCRTPGPERWQWTGSSATLTSDLGSPMQLTALAIAYHTLPPGAVVTAEFSTNNITWGDSTPVPYQSGVMSALFDEKTFRYVRLNISSATGGAIGWFWVGPSLFTSLSAAVVQRRAYKLERGAGLNPSAAFHGAAKSGELVWSEGALSDDDIEVLMEMLDHCKTNDDEPVIIYPQYTRPHESSLATLLSDDIEMPELFDYNPDAQYARRYSMKLPFTGVMA